MNSQQLLEVLSLSDNATAIYTSENIIIEFANEAMIGLWGKNRSVIGKPMIEALPELEGQPFLDILKNVWLTGNTHVDTNAYAELEKNGELQGSYFNYEYRAVKHPTGEMRCILHTAVDVTDRMLSQQEIQESKQREKDLNEELAAINEELSSSNEELLATNEELKESYNDLRLLNESLSESEAWFRETVNQAPVAIAVLDERGLIIDTANSYILEIWGKGPEIIGQPLHIALPELQGQPFLQILDDVYTSGEPFYGSEVKASLVRKGVLEDAYFNFVYHPLKEASGNTASIIVVATEVTEQINARRLIEKSEHRLNRMVMASPIGMTILKGRELVIEIANENMLTIWNRTTDQVTGKRLLEIFPELIGQPFPDMLQRVFDTGQPFGMDETTADVDLGDGRVVQYYLDFSYDPLFDADGNVEAILATVNNITERVESRRQMLHVQERGRMAVDAAQLGTFDMDLTKGTLDWDERCRTLFGVSHNNTVTYEHDFLMGLHPDDREHVTEVINNSFNKAASNGNYDVEYRTIGFEDKKLRWVSAKGKVFFNEHNEPMRFIGIVLDITDKKEDEQRKNDFIAMVSHELKTPLTSLKAYVQVLQAKALKANDGFAGGALDKSLLQVNKMNTLIKGFLDVARLESGRIHLDVERFNLNNLIKEAVEEATITMDSHHVVFDDECHTDVVADREKIGQVLNNLISNATKYSPRGSNIIIKCYQDADMVRVSVKDEGIGVKAVDIDKLFDRFYRVNSPFTKTISGFGIGLYLCAEIIKYHRGRIWVESKTGQGATFNFEIPVT
ncbi:PAS domain-containing protein [Mucilaginibacter sp. UR6-1]|uniref:PAS domain-containing protein n=1 Tax=Mucilaginibacter sp. UR6-1 TaxID=1435643 RepID=UPI001E5C55D1|nr:PAS domain-containing protein [Mucilaginibacter sp. UR6-1]MCC8408724.1 PAS domain-containing protein [Mucilaginibacter sp. UR6-1]